MQTLTSQSKSGNLGEDSPPDSGSRVNEEARGQRGVKEYMSQGPGDRACKAHHVFLIYYHSPPKHTSHILAVHGQKWGDAVLTMNVFVCAQTCSSSCRFTSDSSLYPFHFNATSVL